jgi:hypothetical protein
MTRKLLNFSPSIYLSLIVILLLNCCQNKSGNNKSKAVIKQSKPASVKRIADDFESRADSIYFFDLDFVEGHKGDSVGFVSVSDAYAMPGDLNTPTDSLDQLVIPSLKNKKAEQTRYLILASTYRKRLLEGTGITEKDSLFVYNYSRDVLLSCAISSLDAAANLSAYEDVSEAEHTASEYQFGFQINRGLLKEFSHLVGVVTNKSDML